MLVLWAKNRVFLSGFCLDFWQFYDLRFLSRQKELQNMTKVD
jgi:hypothetical protein